MKSLIWKRSIHVIGPNSVIETNENGDQLTIRSCFGMSYFNILDSEKIRKRYDAEPAFKVMLVPIIGQILSVFLATDEMKVCDLESSIVGISINQEADETKENGESHVEA